MGKIACFGDVHGKPEQLKELIRMVREKEPDIEIYSLGDLIDRGRGSKEVIQICIDEGVKGIIGNHDQWLQQLVVDKQFDPFCMKPIMGGKATLLSYDVDMLSDGVNYFPDGRQPAHVAMEMLNAIPEDHAKWVGDLPPYLKVEAEGETFWLIHAGLTIPVSNVWGSNSSKVNDRCSDDEMMERIAKNQVNSILWQSPNFSGAFGRPDNLYHFDNAVQVFGHRPTKKPIIKKHFIAMDTGCGTCEPYTLSAIILPDRELIQVTEDF